MVHFHGDRGGEQVRAVRMLVVFLDQQVHRCLRDGHRAYGVFRLGPGELQGAVRVADILFADRDGFVLDVQVIPPYCRAFAGAGWSASLV